MLGKSGKGSKNSKTRAFALFQNAHDGSSPRQYASPEDDRTVSNLKDGSEYSPVELEDNDSSSQVMSSGSSLASGIISCAIAVAALSCIHTFVL